MNVYIFLQTEERVPLKSPRPLAFVLFCHVLLLHRIYGTVLLILLLWAGSDTEYEDENQKSLKASKISRRQELDPKLRYLYGITPPRFVP